MSSDERPQPDSGASTSPTEPLAPSLTPVPDAAASRRDRWTAVREPAQRHPFGVAIGAAVAGLVIGLLGGLAIDAHPTMSLTVGTAPYPGDAVQAPRPPPGLRHAEGDRTGDPGGPPPPPGERGPAGPVPPPPPPGYGPPPAGPAPFGPGQAPAPGAAPDARGPVPGAVGPVPPPVASGSPPPTAPLPAEAPNPPRP